MSKRFHLTKRAFEDIKNIFTYSGENWGEAQAKKYINALYSDFKKISDKTELGNSRKYRYEPFLMYPSGRHYIVYELFKDSIIIITVINQVRNIENIMIEFGSSFRIEIEELKAALLK